MTNKRIAMISVHECPLASSEGKERGGINVYTFELSKALTELGWYVDAFTRIQDTVNPRIVQVNDRFRVVHVPCGEATPLSKKEILKKLPECAEAMNSFLEAEQLPYTAIHSHYYLSGVVSGMVPYFTRHRVPNVITFHTLGLLKLLVSQSGESDDPPERIPLERSLIGQNSRIITSSQSGNTYLSDFYDTPEEKISVIPPGVDTGLFKPMDTLLARTHIHAGMQTKIILAVGRIDPVKGFDILIAAIKILTHRNPEYSRNLCLVIVGGDVNQNRTAWSGEMKKLQALRDVFGLTASVKFVPPLPQSELPYYYNAADVLVMPSHYESFGMVALEALACGTPVIATDVTGISPLIKDLGQGHLISTNNPIALADAVSHVLHSPRETHGRDKSIESLDWKHIAQLMESEYLRA